MNTSEEPQPSYTLEEGLSQVAPGWHGLLRALWPTLSDCQVTKVREKRGALEVEILPRSPGGGAKYDAAIRAIQDVRKKSLSICSICGDQGRPMKRQRDLVFTRCESHTDTLRSDIHVPVYKAAYVSVYVQEHRHLLIGTSALNAYVVPPVEAEKDILLKSHNVDSIQTILSWLGVAYRKEQDSLEVPDLKMDFLDAGAHPVLAAVLHAEGALGWNAVASPEALAAIKLIAAISPTRRAENRKRDALEYEKLVRLPQFVVRRYLECFKGSNIETQVQASQALAAARKGDPIEIREGGST